MSAGCFCIGADEGRGVYSLLALLRRVNVMPSCLSLRYRCVRSKPTFCATRLLLNVEFEITAFQFFAQFAQRQVEIEATFDFLFGIVFFKLVQHPHHVAVVDFVVFAVHGQAFDHVAQLLDIARPFVLAQAVEGGRCEFDVQRFGQGVG